MKHKINNTAGFTVLEISLAAVVALLVVSIGTLAYQRTAETANRKKEQAAAEAVQKLTLDQAPQKAASETITAPPAAETAKTAPTPAPAAKPAPAPSTKQAAATTEKTKPSYTMLSIGLADVQTGDDNYTYLADWSGNQTGTCTLYVRHTATGTKIYKEQSVVNGTSCSFSLAKSELTGGEWKYYVTYVNKEYTVKGETVYKYMTH
jgi:type II secretory pathway pseudopilin PulG